jgi:hypothetical protein
MVVRCLGSLARRAGQGEDQALEQLALLESVAVEQLGAGVAGFRAWQPPAGAASPSWRDVGQLLGVKRQTAQQRFGSFTTLPAHPPKCSCGMSSCPRITREQETRA